MDCILSFIWVPNAASGNDVMFYFHMGNQYRMYE